MVDMKTYMQDSTTGQVFVQHRCGGALIAPDAVLTGEGEGPAVGQLEGRQRCQPSSVHSGGAPHLAPRSAAPAGVDASANNQKRLCSFAALAPQPPRATTQPPRALPLAALPCDCLQPPIAW